MCSKKKKLNTKVQDLGFLKCGFFTLSNSNRQFKKKKIQNPLEIPRSLEKYKYWKSLRFFFNLDGPIGNKSENVMILSMISDCFKKCRLENGEKRE